MSFFSNSVEDLLASNPVVLQFKKEFMAMQTLLIDLEHRIEGLEETIKGLTKE